MTPLILLGGGGHCRSCIDVIEATGQFTILGILDLAKNVGQDILGHRVLGTDSELSRFANEGATALVSVGQIQNSEARQRLFKLAKSLGMRLPVVISPFARVSPHATLGEGTVILHQACVNAGVTVGENSIINTQALLEHDVKIGSHCHVSTRAVLNGGALLGNGSFLGSGAIVTQGIRISANVVIGAGSLVRENINDPGTYVSAPGGKLRCLETI